MMTIRGALIAVGLGLAFLLGACATARVHVVTPIAWTLSEDAGDEDRFCVVIVAAPAYPPEAVGLHCTQVRNIRMWLGHLQYAH